MEPTGVGKKKFIALLIFIAVVAVAYLNGINNDFVFDDQPLIVRNESIKDFDNVLGIFNYDNSKALSYRPVRFISLAIDYAISGDSPIGFHISNMIYHVISGYLVFLILQFMFTSVPWLRVESDDEAAGGILTAYTVSLLATIIFLVHPVQVDSVTYISGRRDILSTLFFLLAFLSYLKFRYLNKKWHLALVVLFYLTAISAKEMAITLPAVIIAFEIVENMKNESKGLLTDFLTATKNIIKRYKFLVVALLIFGAAFTWYSVIYREASHQRGWHGDSILINFLTVAKIWVTYLRLIFFPIVLSADYKSFPLSTSPFEPATMLSIGLVALFFYATFKLLKSNRALGFGLLWYIITLLPVSQIIPHHEMMA